jgi:hypothetical protein
MALEKIKPRVVDESGNYTFNNVTATGNLVTSNANLGNVAVANYVTGTLTTNAQPNVTSLGTLSNLTVTGNISAGNIKTNSLLYANGSPWAIGTSTTVAGSNTQIQFNDSSSFAGSANLTFDKTTDTLSVTNIIANGSSLTSLTGANVTGQVSNALIAGTVYTNAQPNITSVGTLTSLVITGNITSGNANLGNLVTGNFFSGSGNLLSNIQGGNVTGQVSYAAIANSVAGANVSGQVAYAATANAVAGGNVFGAVASATVADSANSVTGANVSGQVGNSLVAGTVYTNAQPNITSVGTLTSLTVTGNITAGNANLGTGNLITTGNVSANILISTVAIGTAPLAITSTTKVTNLNADLLDGYDTATANTANTVAVRTSTGNLSANFFTGNGYYLTGIDTLTVSGADVANRIANGTSNIDTPASNGNITVGISGVANTVIFTSTGINAAANVSANILISRVAQGTSPLAVTSNTKVTNLNADLLDGYDTATANTANTVAVRTSTGNLSANFFTGNGYYLTGIDQLAAGSADVANSIANGTSNINTPTSGGNITVGIGGTGNTVIFTSTGVNVAGYISPSTGSGTNGIIWPSNPGGGTGDVASIKYYAVTGEQTRLEINVQNDVPGVSQDDIYFTANSYVVVNNSTEATSTSSAPFQVLGGAGIAKKLFVGGNIEAGTNFIKGNGYYLTGVDQLAAGSADIANSIANGTSNINTPTSGGNITVGIGGISNTVIFTSTGVNVAGNLAISGNLTVSGTTTTVNSTTTRVVDPIFELGGGANGAALSSDDNKDRGLLLHYYSGATPVDAFIGWDDSNTEFAFGSNVTITSEVTTFNSFGNVRANYFIGNGSQLTGISTIAVSNGTSNVSIPAVNSNVTISVAGISNIATITNTGVNVAGHVTATGNLSAGSNYVLGNGYYLTGVDTAGRVVNGTSNISITTINGSITMGVAGNSNVVVVSGAGANIAGYANITGNVDITGNITGGNANLGNLVTANYFTGNFYGNANTAGTVTTNAQPNITSVGTLSSLTVGNAIANTTFGNGTITAAGNISFTGANVSLGSVGNLKITGGAADYYLKTDGAGTLSWSAVTGGGGGGGVTLTSATTPPATGNLLGDQWYNTSTDVLYEYINDGVASYWVDTQTSSTASYVLSSYINRSYTANGTGTTYAVTLGCGVNDVLVFLNGLCQMPTTDYTISGTTLTLDVAPDSGTIIQIRELPR